MFAGGFFDGVKLSKWTADAVKPLTQEHADGLGMLAHKVVHKSCGVDVASIAIF